MCRRPAWTVAFRPGGETLSVSNDARGIARLIKIVKNAQPHCVVLEATGGFELMLLGKTERGRPTGSGG